MRTLEAGTSVRSTGFTLLELLVVVAIMAIATAGVGFALRDSSQSQLERDAQRLVALLESARAQSRMSANPIVWRVTDGGFAFEGNGNTMPSNWLGTDIRAANTRAIALGPEPILGPQRIVLQTASQPVRTLIVATDGVRPFAILSDVETSVGKP